jgi:hypothetical protein
VVLASVSIDLLEWGTAVAAIRLSEVISGFLNLPVIGTVAPASGMSLKASPSI